MRFLEFQTAIMTVECDAYTGIELGWNESGTLKQTIVSANDTAGIEGTNEYGYDVDQKRVSKKITRNSSVVENTVYIYAGPNCIAEYQSGMAPASPDQEYVYAQAIDSLVMLVRNSGSEKLNVTRNQQWSVSALTDNSTGNVVERYTYDVFGKRTILDPNGTTVRSSSNYNNPYGYTSRRHDEESGLMYFRARYYDNQTGEFVSRDPLEFVDGMSTYRGYFVPAKADPKGQIIVSTVGIPNLNPDCGFRSEIKWDFTLEQDAPCDGYIVQKIEFTCSVNACKNCRLSPPQFPDLVFWEAWPVKEGKRVHVEHGDAGYTDLSTITTYNKSCGQKEATGEIRFYCKDKTGDLGGIGQDPGDPSSNWKTKAVYGKDLCKVSPVDLPSTDIQPDFWLDNPVEGPARRRHSGLWNCCPWCFGLFNHDIVTINASPDK